MRIYILIKAAATIRNFTVTNQFRAVGEIKKLQAPECRLDSRPSRASKACGIVPCGVCVYCPNVVLLLGRRRRQWTYFKTTLGQCLVFAGYVHRHAWMCSYITR